ncbi:MAG: helix-turn-helix transcriptional regulator [archaeon]|nr:helix-turn-helix transcriptional regulator [archaeon]
MSGHEVKEMRLKMGMTQSEFARRVGCTRRTLIRWEVENTSNVQRAFKDRLEAMERMMERGETLTDKDLPVLRFGEGTLEARSKHYRAIGSRLDRETIEELLETSGDRKVQKLVRMMLTPRYKNTKLGTLASKCGVTPGRLREFLRKGYVEKAIEVGAVQLPAIFEDMAEDAKSTFKPCFRCDGKGWVIGKEEDQALVACGVCGGKGAQRIPGDKGSRELLFDATGAIQKKSAPLIAQQFNIGQGGVVTHEEIIQKANRALLGPGAEATSGDPNLAAEEEAFLEGEFEDLEGQEAAE